MQHATRLRVGFRWLGQGSSLVLIAALLPACADPGPVVSPEQAHVLFLPGIGGSNLLVRRTATLINEQLPGYSAQTWDWTDIDRVTPLGDLMNEDLNRRRARRLADELLHWRQAHPRDRLYLAATSGGAGIILFACQQLPPDFRLERIIFISPALSRDVDLTPILRRSRLGLFNYYSHLDVAVLGVGTGIFGTTDRKHAPSAGLVGFDLPADPALAVKIEQLAWEPAFTRLGNIGGHSGAFASSFLEKHILPEFLPSGAAAGVPVSDASTAAGGSRGPTPAGDRHAAAAR